MTGETEAPVADAASQPAGETSASDAVFHLDDPSYYLKSKKKAKKSAESEALATKLEEVVQVSIEPAKPAAPATPAKELKATYVEGQYEFAEMLDVRKGSSEYAEMKDSMALTYPFELDPFQQQAVVAMENGHSVFVAAHTSAGKTVVAEYAIALSRKHQSRVVYTSPIKALSNQKFRDFKNHFEDVGLITGDIQLNTEAFCLIMTTEILKSMLYNGRVSSNELEWVIFDEVHYINDADRGHVWEEVLIMLPEQVNIVMLSATVPNCLEFADWVGRIKNRKIYVVQTLFRPVPLAHHIYSGKDKKTMNNLFCIMDRSGEFNKNNFNKSREAQLDMLSKKSGPRGGPVGRRGAVNIAVERCHYMTLINYLRERQLLPAVAFIFSRNKCNQYAQLLANMDLTTNDEKAGVRRLFVKYLDSFKGSDRNLPQVVQMQELCNRGFAIHHSGILPILKELVEILFQKGYVKFLFATETFAMGVNMPARTVVFDSIDKFDGNSVRPLNCTEYIQMAGRAGRRGLDDTGVVIIMGKGEPYDVNSLQLMLRGKPVSLESKFRVTYNMLLNILRTEHFNIEDMLQRSYVERVSLRCLASRNEKIASVRDAIKALPKFECNDCRPPNNPTGGIDVYHDALFTYVEERSRNIANMICHYGAANLIVPGRYLVISLPARNIVNLVVCVMRFRMTVDTVDLDVVTLPQKKLPQGWTEDEYRNMSEHERRNAVTDLLFKEAALHKLEAIVNHGQKAGSLELLQKVPIANIMAICKKKSKYMIEKEVDAYFQNQNTIGGRRRSPTRAVNNLMTELETVILNYEANSDDSFFYRIGEEVVPKTVDAHTILTAFATLRKNLLDKSQFSCKRCMHFNEHLVEMRHRRKLEANHGELTYQTSANALLLSSDYNNCLKVLKELNFIDEDNLVTIKGRVAAQINEETLLLTELIFENKLLQRGCSEIAALLCPVTAQHYASKDKLRERDVFINTHIANSSVINSLKNEFVDFANRIDAIERKFDVVNARRGQEPTFGLMEAVYQWAEGMSFQDITSLTDAHEGTIVRCIQRLDEVLKDIQDAGRTIGNNDLVEKMEDTSAAIQRDIVFAASLYTAEEDDK